MEILKVLNSGKSQKLLCAAGLAVAAVCLTRRLWEWAQPEEDLQHQKKTEGNIDELVEAMRNHKIGDEDNRRQMSWDFSRLLNGPVAEVRCRSGECQPAERVTTFRSTECHTCDMMVTKATLVHWTSISNREVSLWVMNTRETTELSPEGISLYTETAQEVTGVKLVDGKVQQYASYCIVDATARSTRFNDRVQINSRTRFSGISLGPHISLSTIEWDYEKTDVQPRQDCEGPATLCLDGAPSPLPPVEGEFMSSTANNRVNWPWISRLRQALHKLVPSCLTTR
ncbi:uncharacterized protein [Paramormyrops kingsleyae]|uniref:uncharacterized protein isoform X1 n=1 Tax=Paramormyrops kingsleyae TaxID=1676925 RepID=UPI003B97721B